MCVGFSGSRGGGDGEPAQRGARALCCSPATGGMASEHLRLSSYSAAPGHGPGTADRATAEKWADGCALLSNRLLPSVIVLAHSIQPQTTSEKSSEGTMTPIHKLTTISLILMCESQSFRTVPLVERGVRLRRFHSGSLAAWGLWVLTSTAVCLRELCTDVIDLTRQT